MKMDLLKIKSKLTNEYEEGLYVYEEGLDNIPQWPVLLENGWT